MIILTGIAGIRCRVAAGKPLTQVTHSGGGCESGANLWERLSASMVGPGMTLTQVVLIVGATSSSHREGGSGKRRFVMKNSVVVTFSMFFS